MAEFSDRPRVLTAYLWLSIVVGLLTSLLSLAIQAGILQTSRMIPDWENFLSCMLGLIKAGSSYALLKFWKLGFYGYCVSTFVAIGIRHTADRADTQNTLESLGGIAILWLLLNFGTDRRVWPRLK